MNSYRESHVRNWLPRKADTSSKAISLHLSRGGLAIGTLAVTLIAGAALGAGGTRLAQDWQPRSVMLLQPAPFDQMAERSPVAIKGDVAEVFGNKFVVQDGSGRALVDTGPRGEDGAIVAKGETVTVQGRFDRGVVHAGVLAHADGRNEAFGPPDQGPKGPKGSRSISKRWDGAITSERSFTSN